MTSTSIVKQSHKVNKILKYNLNQSIHSKMHIRKMKARNALIMEVFRLPMWRLEWQFWAYGGPVKSVLMLELF
jgi:hypothetical protein